jgi:multimeric flavodoxin WrbA
VETEFISLAGKEIKPCNMCYRCSIFTDGMADFNPVKANLENLTEFFEKAFEGRIGFDY